MSRVKILRSTIYSRDTDKKEAARRGERSQREGRAPDGSTDVVELNDVLQRHGQTSHLKKKKERPAQTFSNDAGYRILATFNRA